MHLENTVTIPQEVRVALSKDEQAALAEIEANYGRTATEVPHEGFAHLLSLGRAPWWKIVGDWMGRRRGLKLASKIWLKLMPNGDLIIPPTQKTRLGALVVRGTNLLFSTIWQLMVIAAMLLTPPTVVIGTLIGVASCAADSGSTSQVQQVDNSESSSDSSTATGDASPNQGSGNSRTTGAASSDKDRSWPPYEGP